MTAPRIRAATAADIPHLQEIERRAGVRFREVGMAAIADDDPPTDATLTAYAQDGRSWVAVDGGGAPVGYVLIDVVDGCAHVEQVSVDPAAQGTGVGRALLDHVDRWALERDLAAVTLTTFRDVPWNAPLYAHLGFRALDEHEIGAELQALRAAEADHGLDPDDRVCMRRELVRD